jgi:hypothetical protein
MLAKPPTSSTTPIGTNFDLDKLISTPRQLQSIKTNTTKDGHDQNLRRKKSGYHPQIIDETLGALHYSWTPTKKPDKSPYPQWQTTFYPEPP